MLKGKFKPGRHAPIVVEKLFSASGLLNRTFTWRRASAQPFLPTTAEAIALFLEEVPGTASTQVKRAGHMPRPGRRLRTSPGTARELLHSLGTSRWIYDFQAFAVADHEPQPLFDHGLYSVALVGVRPVLYSAVSEKCQRVPSLLGGEP